MKIGDELLIKKKVYVSTIGWISAILSGAIIYFSIFEIINILVFKQNLMSENLPINENQEGTQIFSNASKIMFLIYGLSIFFSSLFLVCSIGLIKYKNWARNIFIFVSWFFIILSVSAIIIYTIYSGEILTKIINDNIPTHVFNTMTEFMKTIIEIEIASYGILLVILIRTLYQISRRFKTDDFKRLFD